MALVVSALVVLSTEEVRAGQSGVQYMYDDLGRLVAVVDSSGEAAVYVYDAVGNLLTITRSTNAVKLLHFSPQAGWIGTTVTIVGTGFGAAPSENAVTFNGTAAVVTSASSTQLVVSVPPGATTGTVSVTTPSGSATSSGAFAVVASNLPTITGFTPAVAVTGASVAVHGTNFGPLPSNKVTVNTTVALLTAATATDMDMVVPTGGSGRITVKTPAGTAVSAADLFIPPPPFVAADVQVTDRMTIGGVKPISITSAGKIAMVVFDGVKNQRISLRMTGVSITYSYVSLRKPDGAALVASTSVGTSGKYIDTKVLPETGTYTILVDPESTYTGNMTLTLYDVADDVSETISAGGSPVTITTTTPGQNAALTFSGTVGQRISLRTTAVTINWAYVSILRPDGTVLLSPTGTSTNGTFIDTVTLTATGTHTIAIDPEYFYTGALTLTLYDVPADASGTVSPGGSPVTIATTTPGQNAALTFTGTVGQRISLRATAVGIPWSYVSIRRPDGTVLLSPTLTSASGTFINTVTLTATGTHTIVIDPEYFYTGAFTLTLYDVPADASGTIIAGGSAVTITATTPGQNPALTFSGTAGQRVSLRMTGVSISWSLVSIRKPDTSVLVSPTWVSTGGGFFDVKTLPASGTYTIVIDPENANTGSMTLTLYDVPADLTGTLTVGGVALTVTITTPGQNGSLTFSGTQGQQVTVRVTNNAIGNTTVKLLKPDGSTQTSSTSSSSSFNLAIQTLPVTGTYTVAVDPSQWNTGTLDVSVTSP